MSVHVKLVRVVGWCEETAHMKVLAVLGMEEAHWMFGHWRDTHLILRMRQSLACVACFANVSFGLRKHLYQS